MASTNQEMLRHVVLIKFKENTKPEDISRLEQEFRTLATVKINQVKQFEWGTHTGKDNRNQGYTHFFCLTFTNQEDLDTYSNHDDHKEFVKNLKLHLDGSLVIDYFAKH
ncbi:unnamed protein product [Rotaria sp. Silwood1]|nr:unnamed protein product [Rotaria sp. Silwood1]CAF0743499.1 unnamed protein product [Rotaria sp. Silwood1]CAF3336085.1 unnamed protein product [Rotaria sp. Silwood1]CAF3346868.1 unnamed protein product [Rotaria sp. Silwood1]CAF4565248.1 unnamed protein product [Rotaria sp. Silwood1]